jgi:hypothetical protein
MDTAMKQPQDIELPGKQPDIKVDRRSFILQVMLPLLLGILILSAIIALVWLGEYGTASAWADTSLVFILIPWLCVGLFPLAIISAVWYGVFKLTAWLPRYIRKANEYIDKAGYYLRRGSDLAIKPMFVIKGGWAVVSAFFKGLGSLIGIVIGETDG